MDFACIEQCSQCCVEREYFPSIRFGKIGVLILPDEKERIEKAASDMGLEVSILPRIGISDGGDMPSKVLAYQMMGVEDNGNTCPFLDTGGSDRSPHGGLACRIYDQRPLACRAYPVIESDPITLDGKCKFCKECGQADGSLESEKEALIIIKEAMSAGSSRIWRYATGVGDAGLRDRMDHGWIPE